MACCALALCALGCGDSPPALESSLQGTEVPRATPRDAAAPLAPADAGSEQAETDAGPSKPGVAVSCPVHITANTHTYGSGDEAQDDYAPRNVGAIWVSTGGDGAFVRTVAAWGPNYFDHALQWIAQSDGNLVDAITLPTRSTHARPVEATWDCRDLNQQLVAAGSYRINIEFTEAEMQGPVLTSERALTVQLGEEPTNIVRAPAGFFGEIHVTTDR